MAKEKKIDRKFLEKLIIAIVIFVAVVVCTVGIIINYVEVMHDNNSNSDSSLTVNLNS